jgi:OMF family outer membrane factor
MKLVNIYLPFLLLVLLSLYPRSSWAQVWTLEKCIETALLHNKSLKISQNREMISQEKSKVVSSNLLPKINAVGEYKYFTDLPYQLMPMSVFGGPEGQFRETQFGVPHNINANIQLSVPLYNAELYNNISTSKIASKISQLNVRKTEEEVFFEVSNLYYNLQILNNQITFLDSNIKNTSIILQNMKLLKSELLAKETDVDRLKLKVKQLQTQKELLQSRHNQLLNTLKVVMGVDLEQDLAVESEIKMEIKANVSSKQNIDLLLSEQNVLLSESTLKSNKSSRLPTLALFGTYGTTGFGYDESPNEFLDFYPIGFAGLKLNIPIFEGFSKKRKINQSKYELKNASLQSELIADQVELKISNAISQKAVYYQSVQNTEEQVVLAEKIYKQTINQQKQGTSSLTDVLLADNELRATQQEYLSAIIEYLKADLELTKLSGSFTGQ